MSSFAEDVTRSWFLLEGVGRTACVGVCLGNWL